MNDTLLKRTLLVTALMLGASTAVVGVVSLVAVSAAERLVGGDGAARPAATASEAARTPKVVTGAKPNG